MEIVWTEKARENLNHVKNYIFQYNPQAANKTVLKIIHTISLLQNQPSMGKPGRLLSTRELVIPGTPYLVPYRVKNNKIEILRVFHCSQIWK